MSPNPKTEVCHEKTHSINLNAELSKDILQRQNDATDRQIDRLVYDLYGLTEAEIKIVEGT